MAAAFGPVVTDAVTEGVAATVAAQPDDPVDYLGRYLLNFVARKEAEAAESAAQEALAGLREAAAAEKAEQDAKEAPQRAAAAANAEEDKALETRFAELPAVDEAALDALCDLVKARLGVNSVYICRKEPTEGPDESAGAGEDAEEDDGEGGGAAFQLRYVGASSNAQAIKSKHVVEPAGITFDAWKVPAAAGAEEGEEEAEEEEEEDEEGGEKKAKEVPPPPELPVVHVRNVLRERRIRLHELPRLGEYVAVPLRYASLAHADCFPPEPEKPEGEEEADAEGEADADADEEAEGKEEEAGGKEEETESGDAGAGEPEPIPAGVPLERHLAICFDTLGQDRRVGPADVAVVKRWAAVLASALERVEQAQYEVEFRAKQAAAAAEAAAASEVEAGKEEDAAAAAEAKAAALEEAGGEAAPEDVKALIDANERAGVALAGLVRARGRLEGIAESTLAPAEAAVTALHTACRLTGSDEGSLGDAGARKKAQPFWGAIRLAVRGGLVDRLSAWRAEEAAAALSDEAAAGMTPDAVAAVLDGVDADAARAASITVSLVLEWCKAAGEATAAAAAKAAREAEEAAAAAAAEAEAAAAAAAAEGGDAEAAGDGEEEEED